MFNEQCFPFWNVLSVVLYVLNCYSYFFYISAKRKMLSNYNRIGSSDNNLYFNQNLHAEMYNIEIKRICEIKYNCFSLVACVSLCPFLLRLRQRWQDVMLQATSGLWTATFLCAPHANAFHVPSHNTYSHIPMIIDTYTLRMC